jgi:hypothetical protein
MTESAPQRATDVDQPDGGGPSREGEGTGRTPHPEEPAEGTGGEQGTGRTPHPEDPAEGADPEA